MQVSSFRAQNFFLHANDKLHVCVTCKYIAENGIAAIILGDKRSGPVLSLARPYRRADLCSNILCHYI